MHPHKRDFAAADRHAALIMARAAREEGLSRIIYLGGLGEDREDLSHHLKSRHEVALILSHGGTPLTHLRAAMILGSGSASFELMRYLGDRVPVMVTPSWVRTRCQPIAITNVLGYLAGCLDAPGTVGRTFDIGGPDVLSYEDLFGSTPKRRALAAARYPRAGHVPQALRHWAQLVTPSRLLVIPLVEGCATRWCAGKRHREITTRTCERAGRPSPGHWKKSPNVVETSCTDAGCTTPPEWLTAGDAPYAGGTVLECGYRARAEADPEELWHALARIGGETGWYYGDALWRLRGFLDKLVGGVGLRRWAFNRTPAGGRPPGFLAGAHGGKNHRWSAWPK
jgi:hypothetical protein